MQDQIISSSLEVSGSILAPSFTGSFFSDPNIIDFVGTASWAINAVNSSDTLQTVTTRDGYTSASIDINLGAANVTGSATLSHGVSLIASAPWSHAEGFNSKAMGTGSHAEGNTAEVYAEYAHAEGQLTNAYSTGSHAEGYLTETNGEFAHSEGNTSYANGPWSHAEGQLSTAQGTGSHAEGYSTYVNVAYSHGEGYRTQTDGIYSHAEGFETQTNGTASHAEGYAGSALGDHSHAEGLNTRTYGSGSHAEGERVWVYGKGAHGEGYYSRVYGNYSHAEGYDTSTVSEYQTVVGKSNIAISQSGAFIIGDGASSGSKHNLLFAANGKVEITGSLIAPNITGSLFGTASYASTASYVNIIPGPGIIISALQPMTISASLRTVNGISPTNGNVAVSLTSVIVGDSGSFAASSSGAVTGSLIEGAIWVIAGTTGSNSGSNGKSYVFDSGSNGIGQWYEISTYDQAALDARYVKLDGANTPMQGNINMGNYKITSLAPATSSTDTPNYSQLIERTSYYVTTASFNAWTGSNTSSFAGTASYALSSSYAISTSFAISSSLSVSSSLAQTASYINVTGSGIMINWSGSQLQLTGSSKVYVSATPPIPSSSGDLWYDSDDANLYVLYNYISASTSASAWTPAMSQVISATNAISASVATTAGSATTALTASYVNITGSGISVNYSGAQIQLTGSSGASFPYTGSAIISGSTIITGSLRVTGSSQIVGTMTLNGVNVFAPEYFFAAPNANYAIANAIADFIPSYAAYTTPGSGIAYTGASGVLTLPANKTYVLEWRFGTWGWSNTSGEVVITLVNSTTNAVIGSPNAVATLRPAVVTGNVPLDTGFAVVTNGASASTVKLRITSINSSLNVGNTWGYFRATRIA